MNKRRLLITGGTGLLALNWACAMRNTWCVILGTHQHLVNLAGVYSCPLALDDPTRLNEQFDAVAPDLIVHTAGLTSVDKCELTPKHAHHVNVEIARNVALAAARSGSPLVHISTDHLFTGNQSMRTELETPAPVNQYGRTKALAETVVINANPTALVLRTNFFGWGHPRRISFSDWIVYNLRAGNMLPVFDNVFFTPIIADALALAAHQLVTKGASGVFNVVGDERVSKYDFACMLTEHFSLPKHLLLRSRLDDSKLAAVRPYDMSLDNYKAREALGRSLGDVKQFLVALREQESLGRGEELLKSVNLKQGVYLS
jgi:dTDP-4-dehydrorhamnose reductase